MEKGCYGCWSGGGRASGVVAASEPAAKHKGVVLDTWALLNQPSPTLPNSEISVGFFVNSLDEKNATCLPVFLWDPDWMHFP